MNPETVYKDAGFGASVPRGNRPAIRVADASYGFTDPQYPPASDMRAEIAATRRLTEFARQAGMPVISTTIAYTPRERGSLAWLKSVAEK